MSVFGGHHLSVEDAWGTLKITAATRRATGCMNASTASDAAADLQIVHAARNPRPKIIP